MRRGIVEYAIKHNDSGLLIEVGYFCSLENNLLMLLNNPKLSSHLCDRAYEIIASNFEAKQSITKLMFIYDEVLAKPSNKSGSYPIVLLRPTVEEYGHLALRLEELYERFSRIVNMVNHIFNSRTYGFVRKSAHFVKHKLSCCDFRSGGTDNA